MNFIKSSSYASIYKGYEYYKENRVINYSLIDVGIYKGKVKGSNNNIYEVIINVNKPKSSKCNCPFAKDRLVICKHMVALYFTIFPKEAEKYINELYDGYNDFYEYREHLIKELENKINKMDKNKLKQCLWEVLDEVPDYLFDKFLNKHLKDK